MKTIYTSANVLKKSDLLDRIHYACGRNIIPGWLNVDGFDESYPYNAVDPDKAKYIFQMNLAEAHPFPDRFFRFGYSEDFLEHLTQPQSLTFLTECFRTFAEGGILRLSFPGLRGVLLRHYRGTTYNDAIVGFKEAYTDWHHEHFYCEQSLEMVARHIGFTKVRFCQMGVSEYPELRNLETRPDQRDLNIVAELTK